MKAGEAEMHDKYRNDRKEYTPTSGDKERFESYVEKSDECWEWTGGRAKSYGKFNMGSPVHRQYPAHRVAWMLENGSIPDGLCVLHRCDNPPCVRPDHLFLGTPQQNSLDMSHKRRQIFQKHPERVFGELNNAAKLRECDVLEIRRLYRETKITQVQLAAQFGVANNTVSSLVRGRSWASVTEGDPVTRVSPASRKRRLTEDQVREMRLLRHGGELLVSLSGRFGVSQAVVRKIINHKNYREVE